MTDELVRLVIDYQHYIEPFDNDYTPEEEVQQTKDMLECDLDRFVFGLRETLDECEFDDEMYRMTKMVLDAVLYELGDTYAIDFPVTIYATVKIEAASHADAMSIARGMWYNDNFLKKWVVPQYEVDKATINIDEPDVYKTDGVPTFGSTITRFL